MAMTLDGGDPVVTVGVGHPPAKAAPRDAYRLDFPRALRAVRKLIANKEDTQQVFEIMRALAGKSGPRGYAKLLSTPEGGRIAYERVELAQLLGDDAWLDSFAPGTVGAAYRDFIRSENLSAEGLAEESRKIEDADIEAAHPLAWYGRRLRDVHDIWHVLTGYGRDALGEACVVAFSYAQTKSTGFALIALAAANQMSRAMPGRPVWSAVREAYAHGKSAGWLPGQDYQALFAEPLESARARLGIARPATYLSFSDTERGAALAPAMA
jgi:ubiquinone biosynthesis protein COQ4